MKTFSDTRRQRGAILIVALILAMLSGIAVASYIRLGNSSMELSHRSFYANAAINLAETGLEQGMWSLNQAIEENGDAWSGWTINGTTAKRTFAGETFGQGVTGEVRVVIDRYDGTGGAPIVYSKALITPARGPVVEKWLRVDLIKRGRWVNGLIAKDQVIFNGNNATVDSWNSDPDKNPATEPVAYNAADPSVRNDNGSVASVSIQVNSVLVNNADIWGSAATGGAQPSVGNNGSILGKDSAAAGYAKVDPRRISTDFTAVFDPVSLPSTGSAIAAINGDKELGESGKTNVYRVPSIAIGGNGEALKIRGKVTLIVTAVAGQTGISITGKAGILIESGAELTIYTDSDIKIAGNGLLNNNVQPITCTIYGTSKSNSLQQVDIAGNGALKAVAYVPNGNLKINGNGDVMGSFIATDITLVGNAAFHYDESLADATKKQPYGITKWDELSAKADRDAVASKFN